MQVFLFELILVFFLSFFLLTTQQLKVLPAIEKCSGRLFANTLNSFVVEITKKTVGVEHLILSAALVAALPNPDFSLLFNKMLKKFVPYSSLVYWRLIEGNSLVKKTLILAGMRADVALFHSLQASALQDQRLQVRFFFFFFFTFAIQQQYISVLLLIL
jgi:hypothetical protein